MRAHRRQGIVLALSAALVGLVVLAYATHVFETTELSSLDTRFALRGERSPPADIELVLVDDVTFDELDERWPFRRSLHARVIDRLRRDGARVIAYDVQFTEPSDDPREDDALIRAVERAGNVVLAATETDERGESRVFGGDDVVRSVHARSANVLMPFDADRVIRRMPYQRDGLVGFAVAARERASGRKVDRASFARGTALVDYGGPPGNVDALSFSRVLRGRFARGTFRGRTVVVGASAPSLHDEAPTSTTSDSLMPGPEIQAHAIRTLAAGLPLHRTGAIVDIALIVLLGMVAPLLGRRLSPFRALAAALAVAAVFAVCAQIAFQERGVIVVVVYPLVALTLCAIGTLAMSYLAESFERLRVREYFARFVPEQVVDEVLQSASTDLRLGGVRRVGTVMFTDLRGFTSFAEALEPEQVIDALNHYLTAMSDAILDHGGTLVAYMGDGIMAVFGAPIAHDDHADQALAAAREMLERRLPSFNRWIAEQGLGDGFRMGIGLNTGPVMSGNVGSERRLEYTVIGDTTNTSARLEAMTKNTPHQLLVADATKQALTMEVPDLVYVDELAVRGRRETLRLWTLAP